MLSPRASDSIAARHHPQRNRAWPNLAWIGGAVPRPVPIWYAIWSVTDQVAVHILDRPQAPVPPGATRSPSPHVPAYLVGNQAGRRGLLDIFAQHSARADEMDQTGACHRVRDCAASTWPNHVSVNASASTSTTTRASLPCGASTNDSTSLSIFVMSGSSSTTAPGQPTATAQVTRSQWKFTRSSSNPLNERPSKSELLSNVVDWPVMVTRRTSGPRAQS